MFSNDHELFKHAMRGVKPLKQAKRARVSPVKKTSKIVIRKPDTKTEAAKNIYLEETGYTQCDAHAVLFFAKPGLQSKTLRQLRQGKIQYTKVLDLHATTLREAKNQLTKFLAQCEQHAVRCALIIHGKGTATLKSAIFTWLKNYDQALAMASAVPRDGGAGALYLLLRRAKIKCDSDG